MRWIELEIVVPAPPAEAFPWVVEPGLLMEWIPQIEELRPRGFLRHRPIVRHGAMHLTLDVRVHRVIVPEVLELDITWRGAVVRLHLEVEEHELGSTVTWRTGLGLPPSLRLAGPAAARELRRIMRRDLEGLAACLGRIDDDDRPVGERTGPTSDVRTTEQGSARPGGDDLGRTDAGADGTEQSGDDGDLASRTGVPTGDRPG